MAEASFRCASIPTLKCEAAHVVTTFTDDVRYCEEWPPVVHVYSTSLRGISSVEGNNEDISDSANRSLLIGPS